MKRRVNPPSVLMMKDRIDVEGTEYKLVVYKRLLGLWRSSSGG
jgi:hypothetical protein